MDYLNVNYIYYYGYGYGFVVDLYIGVFLGYYDVVLLIRDFDSMI